MIRRRFDRLMIGLEDFSLTSGWRWSDNSIVKYLNFAKGEPSNFKGMESCVEIWPNGEWNDFACNDKLYFVCKWHKSKHLLQIIRLERKSNILCFVCHNSNLQAKLALVSIENH